MRLTRVSWALGIAGATLLLGLAVLSVNTFHPLRNEPQAQRVRAPVLRPTLSPKPRAAKAIPSPVSAFAEEQRMTPRQLLRRWDETIAMASRRFSVPQPWIRAVIVAESGGRTMSGESRPIVSSAGAMGLMQLMPDTYEDMRVAYGLGPDPQDPHDNIFAGTAFLHRLFLAYGFPAMFSAYNDGPGNLEYRLLHGELLPRETRDYVADITRALLTGGHGYGVKVKFTRPDGSPVTIDSGAVVTVRAALPGEYAPGVQTVITFGRMRQGVRENLAIVRAKLRGR
jgi:hypothetical protein